MDLELERTFLLKYKPEGLEKSKSCEIIDVYFPKKARHRVLRLRSRDGQKFEMTKKVQVNQNDLSEQEEHTILLSREEFDALSLAEGKEVHKKRYYYELPGGRTAEIDIFLDKLSGLAVVDFEFRTREEKEKFEAPDFCSAEITPDEELAGGILAGGEYSRIEKHLEKYKYKKIV